MHETADQQGDVDAVYEIAVGASLLDKKEKNECERDILGEIGMGADSAFEPLVAAVAKTYLFTASADNYAT